MSLTTRPPITAHGSPEAVRALLAAMEAAGRVALLVVTLALATLWLGSLARVDAGSALPEPEPLAAPAPFVRS